MVEVAMCVEGFLKPLGFVETLVERNFFGVPDIKTLLIEFSRENESLLTTAEEQKTSDKVFIVDS